MFHCRGQTDDVLCHARDIGPNIYDNNGVYLYYGVRRISFLSSEVNK